MVSSKTNKSKAKNHIEKVKLFIGSSSESYTFAYTLAKCITEESGSLIEPILWDKYFESTPSLTFIQVLKKATLDCHFAIFILNRDDQIHSRGKEVFATRANVWFEAGLFMGQHDYQNVYFIFSQHDWGSVDFISDLNGFNSSAYELDKNIVDTLRNISREKKINFSEKDYPVFFNALKKSLKIALKKTKLVENIQEIHSKTKKQLKDAAVLLDADTCFEEGERLIKSANHKLLTSISFTGSLEKGDNDKWKLIEKAIQEKLKSCSSDFVFKRLMNLNDPEIKNQYERLSNFIRINQNHIVKSATIELKHTYCEFLEVIISDDEVIFVFPDFTKRVNSNKPTVGFGILFRKPAAFPILSEWYNCLLTKEIELKRPSFRKK